MDRDMQSIAERLIQQLGRIAHGVEELVKSRRAAPWVVCVACSCEIVEGKICPVCGTENVR